MNNQVLEIGFWLILLIYIAGRLTQARLGHKQQH